ncbi:hypothetical protein D3C80_1389790 [compost metagenome]
MLEGPQLVQQVAFALSGDAWTKGATREVLAVAGDATPGGDGRLADLRQGVVALGSLCRVRCLVGEVVRQGFDLLITQARRQWAHLRAVAATLGEGVQLGFDIGGWLAGKGRVLPIAGLSVDTMAKRAGILDLRPGAAVCLVAGVVAIEGIHEAIARQQFRSDHRSRRC